MRVDRRTFLRLTGLGAVEAVVGQQRPGRRWAMVVDMKKCLEKQGCTKCTEACNRAHNVPEFKVSNHEVKWIWKAPFERVFPSEHSAYTPASLRNQPAVVLCNHCDEPPCVRVCPTQATWKREDGIVMMDWHRCIGCRYCIAGCPYGSRSFNWVDPRPQIVQVNTAFPTRTKGVVEKCNFCEDRLAKGQIPACVEVCPAKAMTFGDVNDSGSEVRKLLDARYTLRRRPELGTKPQVYYLV